MDEIENEIIKIEGKHGKIDCYLVKPKTKEKKPAIIVIHEIFGLVDHIKDVANRFAKVGYVAIAPDVYSPFPDYASIMKHENIALAFKFLQTIPPAKRTDLSYIGDEIKKLKENERKVIEEVLNKMFVSRPPLKTFVEELVKVHEYIKNQDYVKDGKVGSVGFCFGGGLSFLLACYTNLDSCVVFYGQNPEPIDLVANINCPILGIYGGEDIRINENLDKLVAAIVKYKKEFEMKIYSGAPHAFFNDTSPVTYRPKAAKDAWERTLRHFEYSLKSTN